MDDVLFNYFREVGFNESHWKEISEKLGRPAAYRYLKVFGSHGVKRIVEEYRDCVFDFGGGGVTGEFPDEFESIKSALSDFKNVIFLIPTNDKSESLRYLYDRMKINPPGWTILEHLVFHHAHDELAKHTIFVKDKLPEQVCDEILDLASVREYWNHGAASSSEVSL